MNPFAYPAEPLVRRHAPHGYADYDSYGSIRGRTREARRLIRLLDLDGPEATNFRAMWVGIVRLAAQYDPALWRRLLSFPADLPDLSALRPPGGNAQPEGVELSFFRRRECGELPEVY